MSLNYGKCPFLASQKSTKHLEIAFWSQQTDRASWIFDWEPFKDAGTKKRGRTSWALASVPRRHTNVKRTQHKSWRHKNVHTTLTSLWMFALCIFNSPCFFKRICSATDRKRKKIPPQDATRFLDRLSFLCFSHEKVIRVDFWASLSSSSLRQRKSPFISPGGLVTIRPRLFSAHTSVINGVSRQNVWRSCTREEQSRCDVRGLTGGGGPYFFIS